MKRLLSRGKTTSLSQGTSSKSRDAPQKQVASSLPTAAPPSPVKFSEDNPPPPPPKPSTTVDSGPAPTAAAETEVLRADVARLQNENDALKGQVHLLKFKVRTHTQVCFRAQSLAHTVRHPLVYFERDDTMLRPFSSSFPSYGPDSPTPISRWNCSSTWSHWQTWTATS